MPKGKKINRRSSNNSGTRQITPTKQQRRHKNKRRREFVESREKDAAYWRRDEKIQREKLEESLSPPKEPTSRKAQIEIFKMLSQKEDTKNKEGFFRVLRQKGRRLFDNGEYQEALDEVYKLYTDSRIALNNSLDTWKPKGKSKERVFRSLISHLFLQYKIPLSLYSSFFVQNQNLRARLIRVMIGIGNGLSARAMLKSICPVLTKKMVSCFLQSTEKNDLIHAIRVAQILTLGGNIGIARAFCETNIGRYIGLEKTERYNLELMQFFCNQSMLNPSIIPPLYDYIEYLRGAQGKKFSMKGRTPDALIRGMDDWHRELAKQTKLFGKVYKPSGYQFKEWELPGPNDSKIFWKIIEIENSKQLMKEGRSQKHCVASYSHWIERGDCSIWSLRRIHPLDGEEILLTIEVRNQSKMIVQARGRCNRKATQVEERYLYQWAAANGLKIASYV